MSNKCVEQRTCVTNSSMQLFSRVAPTPLDIRIDFQFLDCGCFSPYPSSRILFIYVAVPRNQLIWGQNITCDFLHKNSFLAIEISKDIFPDDKKCKKVQEISLKRFFCIFQLYGQTNCGQCSPSMCAILRVFQPCGQLHCDQIAELA